MKFYPCFKKKAKTGYMAIKPNMEKVYDMLDWNFISKCSKDLDFVDKWIN